MPRMLLGELAQRLECQLEGDADLAIRDIAPLELAGPGDLSFVLAAGYAAQAATTRASALLTGLDYADARLPRLRSANPQLALARAIAWLRPVPRPPAGIHPTACLHPTARLGPGCYVGAYAVIGAGCEIGAEAVIHPHVVLYDGVRVGRNFLAHAHAVVREGCRLGDDVILQPGAIIGGDGFGFARRADGGHEKIPQAGGVEIGDRVEVQANSCVDRATLGATVIGEGTKIDNLTQVAHNCRLGRHVILCAQVGVAGSTVIEDEALLAGQAGVAGHCTVGRGTIVTAQSGTHGDLAPGTIYSGSPAFEHRQWLRSTAVFAKLGELARTVHELRAEFAKLARRG